MNTTEIDYEEKEASFIEDKENWRVIRKNTLMQSLRLVAYNVSFIFSSLIKLIILIPPNSTFG